MLEQWTDESHSLIGKRRWIICWDWLDILMRSPTRYANMLLITVDAALRNPEPAAEWSVLSFPLLKSFDTEVHRVPVAIAGPGRRRTARTAQHIRHMNRLAIPTKTPGSRGLRTRARWKIGLSMCISRAAKVFES